MEKSRKVRKMRKKAEKAKSSDQNFPDWMIPSLRLSLKIQINVKILHLKFYLYWKFLNNSSHFMRKARFSNFISSSFYPITKKVLTFQISFHFHRCDIMYHSQRQYSHTPVSSSIPNGLNSRSRSVPEGLAHPNGDIHWNYNRTAGPYNNLQQHSRSQSRHNVQVLEQITTSVWPKINCQNMFICICVYVLEGIVAFIS